MNTLHAASPKTISIFSDFLPRFDASSANLRIFEIVMSLLDAGYKVAYYWWLNQEEEHRYKKNFPDTISFHFFERNADNIVQCIHDTPPDLLWFTNLWGTDWIESVNDAVISLHTENSCIPVVIDTMDYHAKKYLRKYELEGKKEDADISAAFYAAEKKVYRNADAVVVVSDEEKKDIIKAFPDTAPVHIISNIHRVSPAAAPFEKRKNLVFLGNYAVAHNIDAVRWFVDTVLADFCLAQPDAGLHLLGKEADRVPEDIAGNPHVYVSGYAEDIPAALAQYRVMVVPLTYGAGMKGKIGSAAACGLPLVTTSSGAEGYGFVDGVHALISDSPEGFLSRCISLYTDKAVWQECATRSLELMQTTLSHEKACETLLYLVHTLIAEGR